MCGRTPRWQTPPVRPSLLVLCSLLLPALALADVDPRFARLRDEAVPLGSLHGFLEKYIGECTDVFASRECKENAKQFRAEANRQRYYMIVNEDQANMLSPGPYDPRGEYTVNIAPFFAAGGYAVTHGAPKKTDANGNPVMMYLQAKGQVPPGWNAPRFQRLFQTRALRVQVVFTPQEVWDLPRKGGGKQHGVKAKVHAILVSIGRTGESVALWVDPASKKR
jgi:hypothetical protein